VVEEDLRKADPEQREAAGLQRAAALQAEDQEREPDDRPHGADRGVAALERGVDASTCALGRLEDCERRRVETERTAQPDQRRADRLADVCEYGKACEHEQDGGRTRAGMVVRDE